MTTWKVDVPDLDAERPTFRLEREDNREGRVNPVLFVTLEKDGTVTAVTAYASLLVRPFASNSVTLQPYTQADLDAAWKEWENR